MFFPVAQATQADTSVLPDAGAAVPDAQAVQLAVLVPVAAAP